MQIVRQPVPQRLSRQSQLLAFLDHISAQGFDDLSHRHTGRQGRARLVHATPPRPDQNLQKRPHKVIVALLREPRPERIREAGLEILGDVPSQRFDGITPFGDAVQDNNEGNPMENLTLTFSTGDHIDTMKILGTVLNAADLEPIAGAFVGIYAINEDGTFAPKGTPGDSVQLAIDSIVALYPDSIFSLRPFERAGKSDAYGRFKISGVAPGYYRMFALMDGNTNYKYDLFTEDIAFVDTLISPSVGSHMASDTIWNRFDSTMVDSIYVHEVTDYYPNDLCLRMFNEGRLNRYLDNSKWKDSITITFTFAAALPEPPVITLPDGVEMVMPGDNIDMEITLITPIAMEQGLRFAIREGGRTVGSGVVAKVIE